MKITSEATLEVPFKVFCPTLPPQKNSFRCSQISHPKGFGPGVSRNPKPRPVGGTADQFLPQKYPLVVFIFRHGSKLQVVFAASPRG